MDADVAPVSANEPTAGGVPGQQGPPRHGLAPHAIVIGVGPGLGASMARRLARAGYDLTLVARSSASLAPVAAQVRAMGRTANEALLDVRDLDAVAAGVRMAGRVRPLALLHYNASMHAGSLLDADQETLRDSVGVNALAPVVAVRAALPDLEATAGRVTLTGGGIALSPRADYGVLALGKSAMRAAGFAMAQELDAKGIVLRMLTVNGFIRPGGRFDPDRIADAFWDHLEDPAAEVERVYDGRG